MRRLASLVLFLVIPALAEDGLKPGFRDLKWGDPAPAEMTRVFGDESVVSYTRQSDKLSIGEAKLAKIRYSFFKNRFFSVIVETTEGHGPVLFQILRSNWGVPRKPKDSVESYNWFKAPTLVGYEINESTGVGKLTIFDEAGYAEVQKYNDEQSAKAKKDL